MFRRGTIAGFLLVLTACAAPKYSEDFFQCNSDAECVPHYSACGWHALNSQQVENYRQWEEGVLSNGGRFGCVINEKKTPVYCYEQKCIY